VCRCGRASESARTEIKRRSKEAECISIKMGSGYVRWIDGSVQHRTFARQAVKARGKGRRKRRPGMAGTQRNQKFWMRAGNSDVQNGCKIYHINAVQNVHQQMYRRPRGKAMSAKQLKGTKLIDKPEKKLYSCGGWALRYSPSVRHRLFGPVVLRRGQRSRTAHLTPP